MGECVQEKRILIVDDDPQSVKITRFALELENYIVEVADTGEKCIEKIESFYPHLVLLDINMPGLNGFDTIKYLRTHKQYISIIFLSADSNTDSIVKGLDSGADDYICKPYKMDELRSRIRCQLRIKDIRDELTIANIKLTELVDIDDLTGLYNMRSLYAKLENELGRARRNGTSFAVVMLDMDHFKKVNDEHDHLFGSYVLAQVGKLIAKNIRNIDFAARYGGDEFIIVLTDTDIEGVTLFTDRLREEISETEFKSDLHMAKITTSMGFALTPKRPFGYSAKEIVREADRTLYDAKFSGRNCVKFKILEKINSKTKDSKTKDSSPHEGSGHIEK